MDNFQILIIIIVTTITILTIIIGFQLLFVLKDLRSLIKKVPYFITEKKNKIDEKKTFSQEKKSNIYSILNKIKILSPKNNKQSKKVFLKTKKSFDFKKNI